MGERRLGSPLLELDTVGSTNDVVKAAAERGHPEGLVVVARAQKRGRGRFGRRWHSPPGLGVYMSVLLRPPERVAEDLVVLGALAVVSALERLGLQNLAIKWPNDVLAGGRKIAGVLIEPRRSGQELDFVVMGIGINVLQTAEDWPSDLAGRVTSCRMEGVEVQPAAVWPRVLEQLNSLYERLCGEGRLWLQDEARKYRYGTEGTE